MAKRTIAPGLYMPLPLPIGWVVSAQREPIEFLFRGFRKYGDVFRYQSGPFVFHQLTHPDHVKHVLQDDVKNYPRSKFYDLMKLAVGEGLVTSDGAYWLRNRRMAQPAFQRNRVVALADSMVELTSQMIERWRRTVSPGESIDVATEMMRLTLGIAGKTLFDADISGEADTMGRAVTQVFEYLNYRINHLFALPVGVPTPRNVRFRRALRELDRVVYDIIRAHRARTDSERSDLLSMLMNARDVESGEAMTDRQLRDEVITFIGAGHETTAQALAWTWYLLSRHPEIERRVRAEVQMTLGDRPPTAQDLPQLAYTRMVIEEAMRLYPPVWGVTRRAAQDDEIGGFHIPRNSIVILCQYITHRHPEFWENPEGFDPDRFAPDRVAARPRYAYFPFLFGPHQCIGNEFAMMELIIVLAMVLQSFRLELRAGCTPGLDTIFTLRPKGGVWMTLHPVAGPRVDGLVPAVNPLEQLAHRG
jgi:cytochrome P450